jgi:hypothetical protein
MGLARCAPQWPRQPNLDRTHNAYWQPRVLGEHGSRLVVRYQIAVLADDKLR